MVDRKRFRLNSVAIWAFGLSGILLSACTAPKQDPKNPEDRTSIVETVQQTLSSSDCTTAIATIDPLYHSANTNNEVRMTRATAYGCAANVKFLETVATIATAGNLGGAAFWKTMAQTFPSVAYKDTRVEAGWGATDALLSAIKTGSIIPDAYKVIINDDKNNPGSLLPFQRIGESNLYMIFVSMGIIGALENRYSAPDPTLSYIKTQPLGYKTATPDGWQVAANVDEEGCSFASSVLNMFDALQQASDENLLGAISGNLTTVSTLKTVLNRACEVGCQGTAIPTYAGAASGCTGFAVGACDPCPITLRNRKSCTGKSTDINSCAAAGMMYFINNDTTAGWPGP